MILLQVVLGHEADAATEAHWAKRFGRFYSPAEAMVQYPVSCDSHGFDVFRDEFTDTWVDHAALIELPYPVEQFTPFTEETAGTDLCQWFDGVWNEVESCV